MNNQLVLKSNLLILFSDLEYSIKKYLECGYAIGETKYIDAYLAATIHALIDYADKYLDKDDEKIQACRYANNSLKHHSSLITHKEITGGFSFPVEFPLYSEKIEVVWNYDSSVKVRHKEQQIAFENHFAGKAILETLRPIMQLIEKSC